MIKSALMFTKSELHFIIVIDDIGSLMSMRFDMQIKILLS